MMRTAVLITSYNRKQKTIKSIKALQEIDIKKKIYLVDDKSEDGTSSEVRKLFPDVIIQEGDGNLFWNRGMHKAWEMASQEEYDFYLWLNDDVLLYKDAFTELFACSHKNNHKVIISGIIENKERNQILYGGSDKHGLIKPNGKMNPIHHMNGNVVLVPKFVFNKLGNLDPVFHHDLGDVDYGLRAQKAGIGVYTTRKSIASGTKNDIVRVRKFGVSRQKRFEILQSPLGSPPKINFYFRRKHYGLINAILFVGFLFLLNVLSDNIVILIFGKKYQ
nr:glycosyltransferase family 2 protein [uncultured Draconibacterium sp.]